MDNDDFWGVIEEARARLAADDRQHEALGKLLVEALRGRKGDDIARWEFVFWQTMSSAYRWDLWGVSELVNDHQGEQGFVAFRTWLIGLGRQAFEAVLADPDSAAELLPRDVQGEPCGDVDGELVMMAPRKAYEAAYQAELPTPTLDLFREPRGEPLRDSELTTTFPRVAKALGL